MYTYMVVLFLIGSFFGFVSQFSFCSWVDIVAQRNPRLFRFARIIS